jgi:hypothetical protein
MRFSSKLSKVVEMNFTLGFHHTGGKQSISMMLDKSRWIMPSMDGLPSPSNALPDPAGDPPTGFPIRLSPCRISNPPK